MERGLAPYPRRDPRVAPRQEEMSDALPGPERCDGHTEKWCARWIHRHRLWRAGDLQPPGITSPSRISNSRGKLGECGSIPRMPPGELTQGRRHKSVKSTAFIGFASLIVLLLTTGCAPSKPAAGSGPPHAEERSLAPKRI